MYHRSYPKTDNQTQLICVSSNNKYVDVFGRLITTYENGDSGEMYISLADLKKSGFELFQQEVLKKVTNINVLSKMQMEQLDLILRMKAVKFLNNADNNLLQLEDVDSLIQKQKQGFQLDLNRSVEMTDKPGKFRVTAHFDQSRQAHAPSNSPQFENYQQNRNTGHLRRPNRSYDNYESDSKSTSEFQGHSGRRSYEAPAISYSETKRMSENFQGYNKTQMVRQKTFTTGYKENQNYQRPNSNFQNGVDVKRNFSRNTSYENNRSAGTNKPLQVKNTNEESFTPENSSSFYGEGKNAGNDRSSISPVQRTHVQTVTPKKAVKFAEPEPEPEAVNNSVSPSRNSIEAVIEPVQDVKPVVEQVVNNAVAPLISKVETTQEPAQVVKPVIEQKVAPPLRKPQQSSELLEPVRKLVVEKISEAGTFECVEVVNNTQMIAFVFPGEYEEELIVLDEIDKDSVDDPNFVPHLGQLVAISYNDTYVRGLIINMVDKVFTCALIDFGVIQTSTSIRRLPEKFINIPEFTCICTSNNEDLKEIVSKGVEMMSIETPNVLTLKLRGSDVKYKIKAERWNAFVSKPIPIKVEVYKMIENLHQLKSDDVVIILKMDSNLFVRTKECVMLLKEVNKKLQSYQGEPLNIVPELNQLCVYSDEKNTYRVQIIELKDSVATINCFDYAVVLKVPISELKTINKTLAEFSNTVIKISLYGFVGATFSENATKMILASVDKKEKFSVVVKGDDNVFDLLSISDKSSLSEKLKQLDVKPQPVAQRLPEKESLIPVVNSSVFKLNSLAEYPLEIGLNNLICTYVGDLLDGIAVFGASCDLMSVLLKKVAESATIASEPYEPNVGELCIAKFYNEWYRAVVTNLQKSKNEYFVYFVDFGNSYSVSSIDIRKFPADLLKYPRAALVCTLQGTVKHGDVVEEPLLTRMQSDITENECYDVNIIKKTVNGYSITIPKLYEQWKTENLL